MRLALAFAIAIIVMAIAFGQSKQCTADSAHGVAIAGVMRISGCP